MGLCLLSACELESLAQGLAASLSQFDGRDGASRGHHTVVSTLPLENALPVSLLWVKYLVIIWGRLAIFVFDI